MHFFLFIAVIIPPIPEHEKNPLSKYAKPYK